MTDWTGGQVTARARCVLAPNPGPMTLDGTNTWVLAEPGSRRCVVVDPGPLDDAHLSNVRKLAGDVAVVLLTHGHPDHAAGARLFAGSVGCDVRAVDPAHRVGALGLEEGNEVGADGLELRVVATPGHTSDSVSLLIPAEQALLTGDTVLGQGTTVVAHPDGRLGDYLASLRRLRELAEREEISVLLPGHGPPLEDARAPLDHYLEHRLDRLEQVRRAVAAGAASPREVVERVYVDVDRRLWPAAELSVRAQLAYLSETGA